MEKALEAEGQDYIVGIPQELKGLDSPELDSGLKPFLERETGLEPATTCLEGRHSTAELLPQKLTFP